MCFCRARDTTSTNQRSPLRLPALALGDATFSRDAVSLLPTFLYPDAGELQEDRPVPPPFSGSLQPCEAGFLWNQAVAIPGSLHGQHRTAFPHPDAPLESVQGSVEGCAPSLLSATRPLAIPGDVCSGWSLIPMYSEHLWGTITYVWSSWTSKAVQPMHARAYKIC